MCIDISFLVGKPVYLEFDGDDKMTGLNMYGNLCHDEDDLYYVAAMGAPTGDCYSSECWFREKNVLRVTLETGALAPIMTIVYK